jgi:hypothetical protein
LLRRRLDHRQRVEEPHSRTLVRARCIDSQVPIVTPGCKMSSHWSSA